MMKELEASLGNVKVHTVDNRFFSAEELADMAVNDIIAASETASDSIKDSVNSYRKAIRARLIHYFEMARKP